MKEAVHVEAAHPAPLVFTHWALHVHASVQLLERALTLRAPAGLSLGFVIEGVPRELLSFHTLGVQMLELFATCADLTFTYLALSCRLERADSLYIDEAVTVRLRAVEDLLFR